MKRPDKRLVLLVMGMHRSGTSAVTRVLHLLGCDLPATLMPAGLGNEEGHWESEATVQFNDRLLDQMGSGWDDWLPISLVWRDMPRYAEDLAEARRLLRQEFGQSPLFVFKDPRHCRIGALWADALRDEGVEPRYVLMLRNPLEVAASLSRRNGIEQAYGLLLWLRHALDAERLSRGARRVVVFYPSMLADWRGQMARLSAELEIEFPRKLDEIADEVNGFIRPTLRHHLQNNESLLEDPTISPWVRRIYEILLRWSHGGECEADYLVIDALAAEIYAVTPAFAGLLRGGHEARMAMLASEGKRSGESDKVAQDEVGAEAHRQLIAAQEAALQALQAQVQASEARLGELEIRLTEEMERAHAQQTGRQEAERRHHEAEQALADAQRETERMLNDRDGRIRWLEDDMARLGAQSDQLVEGVEAGFAEARAALEARIVELGHQVAQLESQLAQQREESAQAWHAADAERHAKEEAKAAASAAQKRSDMLADKLASSEAWVFQLAGERRLAELELARQTKALGDAERRAERSDQAREDARAAQARLAQVHQALQLLEGELARFKAAPPKPIQPEAGLVDAAVADALEQQRAEFAAAIGRRDQELAQLASRMAQVQADAEKEKAEAGAARIEAERKLNERFSEVANLTSLLRQRDTATKLAQEQADWLRQVNAVMTGAVKWGAYLPAERLRRIRMKRLRDKGLFDADAYLALYPDVAAEGQDPLRHYILHGMAERRSRGI